MDKIEKALQRINRGIALAVESDDKEAIEDLKVTKQALELLKLKKQGKVIITPCAVGDQVETKYGDAWRVDGFTTYGDDLKIWCEDENERYVEFSQHEIIKYIPKEVNNNESNQNNNR